jgi:hypothetical protein
MRAKDIIPAEKPRNFVAKNAQSSGAGRHSDNDKKKNQEQGKVKHKKDLIPMEGGSNAIANTASRLVNKDDGKVAKLRAAGDKRREDQLKSRNIAKKNEDAAGIAEETGDKSFDDMIKKVTKAPTAKARNAERIRQKREREEETRDRLKGGFGPSPADKLSIRKSSL